MQLVRTAKSSDAWEARYGMALHRWVQGITPGDAQVVLTDAGLVYNILPRTQVIVRQVHFGVHTASDDCEFEIGSTDQPDGAGTFTPITHHEFIKTGTAPTGRIDQDVIYRPPIRVRYRDGARSITFRVDANDASCEICCGFDGWYEDEVW
jgi:hypothetical protein